MRPHNTNGGVRKFIYYCYTWVRWSQTPILSIQNVPNIYQMNGNIKKVRKYFCIKSDYKTNNIYGTLLIRHTVRIYYTNKV